MAKYKRIKQLVFSICTLAMFLPLLQKGTRIFDLEKLHGAYITEHPDAFNWENWLTGTYQNQVDKYLKEHFGFRSPLVRIHNQINFSLFRSQNVNGTIIGKNDVLFQRPYIDSYFGNDFLGAEVIAEMVLKTKKVQDTLKALGTPLLPVIAPGKVWFQPEFIPDYLLQERKTSNYETFVAQFSQAGVDYLDLQSWLLAVQDTGSFPIFPQYGIHWTNHMGVLVQDTLIKAIDLRTPFETPKLIKGNSLKSFDFKEKEYDILTVMNLWTNPISKTPTYETSYGIEIPEKGRKIKLLSIGDSFYNQFAPEFGSSFCEKSAFWYYNRTIVTDIEGYPGNIKLVNLKAEIPKLDVIIVLLTESNLKDYAFGFINDLHEIYFENKSFNLDRSTVVQMYEDEIRASAEKMEYMRKKAEGGEIPLDTAIRHDAVWLYENLYLPSVEKK